MVLLSQANLDFLIARVSLFLPSIAIIASIASITGIYARNALLAYGENLTSVEWVIENQKKINLKFSLPMINIWAPTAEEVVFRAPIIIGFSALTYYAWYGIIISSALFAALHWRGHKLHFGEITTFDSAGKPKTDDVQKRFDAVGHEKRKEVLVRKVFHVFVSFWAGILFGYLGIQYQSLWAAVMAHAAWNLFAPILGVIIGVIGGLCIVAFFFIKDRIEEWKINRKVSRQCF